MMDKEGVIHIKLLHMVAFALVIVGALNWGLVGLMNLNLVEMVLGSWPMLVQVVYILVGLSAVVLAATHMKDCRVCSMGKK
jgi:uncharacterized protein